MDFQPTQGLLYKRPTGKEKFAGQMVHIRLLEDANDQSMLMKKGSRKPSDNFWGSSHRTFEEQVRQILTTED